MSDVGFVFIPGGLMSTWVWKFVDKKYLGNAVLIPRRIKENNVYNRIHSTLNDCVEFVTEMINDSKWARVVIIAHSGGGLIAPLVAKKLPEKVKQIIFVCANIPRNHTTALHFLPAPIRVLNRIAIKQQIKHDCVPASKQEKAIRNIFCNTSSPDVIDYVLQQNLYPEPMCTITEQINWDGVPEIPMAYIRLTKDKTGSIDLQNRMADNLSIKTRYSIDSDHMVMLSHPKEFNMALDELIIFSDAG
ncbi:MAG TPA: alpha/beta hydrolase [Anaerolineales bacterium]|nr:alpha/beta hydrolase [Anaerolineales bacterium]HLO34361.1 alpha/beta hydrolase [Anaerolineales bacterium]